MRRLTRLRSLLVAAVLAMTVGAATCARADMTYAFAQQQATFTVNGAGITGSFSSSSTSAEATVNGSGSSNSDPVDALQAYLGAAPPAPQNDFSRYSSFVATSPPGPQAGSFTRGDALLTSPANLFTTGANTSNVAESFLNSTSGSGPETGAGSWSLNGSFTAAAGTNSVGVDFSWNNDILASVTGGGTASGSFKVTIAVKDQHSHEVEATLADLNAARSAPPNSTESITSGVGSLSLGLGGLTAGDTMSISITGTELSSVSALAPVPEPATIVMAGVGGVLALAVSALRRRSR